MAATRRSPARSRGPLKGRALVAIGLAFFLVVTTIVVWRRSIGVRGTNDIARLREERRSLVAQEKYLESQLRRATSRRSVVQEAERRLGMTRPTEAQTRFIAVPGSEGRGDRAAGADAGTDRVGIDSLLLP